jgi:hypothetical protein
VAHPKPCTCSQHVTNTHNSSVNENALLRVNNLSECMKTRVLGFYLSFVFKTCCRFFLYLFSLLFVRICNSYEITLEMPDGGQLRDYSIIVKTTNKKFFFCIFTFNNTKFSIIHLRFSPFKILQENSLARSIGLSVTLLRRLYLWSSVHLIHS